VGNKKENCAKRRKQRRQITTRDTDTEESKNHRERRKVEGKEVKVGYRKITT
jgi:hypothetical protein